MKTKVFLIAAAAILAAGVALLHAHQPPANGKCPLGSAMHAGK
jgi:hypothetical protein